MYGGPNNTMTPLALPAKAAKAAVVTSSSAAASGGLAFTGLEVSHIILWGFLLIMMGALSLRVTRRSVRRIAHNRE